MSSQNRHLTTPTVTKFIGSVIIKNTELFSLFDHAVQYIMSTVMETEN